MHHYHYEGITVEHSLNFHYIKTSLESGLNWEDCEFMNVFQQICENCFS